MIKPTKATRAAAPDLFGTPAYYNDANHHQALVEQLKGLGLMPAAWALEDLIEKSALADDLAERVDELEEQVEGLQKENADLEAERDDAQHEADTLAEDVLARQRTIDDLEDELTTLKENAA